MLEATGGLLDDEKEPLLSAFDACRRLVIDCHQSTACVDEQLCQLRGCGCANKQRVIYAVFISQLPKNVNLQLARHEYTMNVFPGSPMYGDRLLVDIEDVSRVF